MTIPIHLINKYNQPVPRYTSYPTVPFWKDAITNEDWIPAFQEQFALNNSKEGISLYIHLPFCESLCTYCGCNKRISNNHKVEDEYLSALKHEWELYLELMTEPPVLREVHLGGGTPTFFSPENLTRLMEFITEGAIIPPSAEFSFEGHPNNTTKEHLETLYRYGFRRVSYGVQDNDPEVQRVINRIQPVENVKRATETAREIGYQSVNFDLIYGLPRQTLKSIEQTIRQVLELKPDRIAFYSYAHVPWTSKGQRLFDENDLPDAELKLQLYVLGKKLLTENGYVDIGMDHFALPGDDLYMAWNDGTLHRNFMGYTTSHTSVLLGLGVSSISDAGTAFAQNSKNIHEYYADVLNGKLSIRKGFLLNEEDSSFRRYILDISCKGGTIFNEQDMPLIEKYSLPELEKLAEDKLVELKPHSVEVTPLGRHFIRNICRAFDLHLLRNTRQQHAFSKAI